MQKFCAIDGASVPRGRRVYCSVECQRESRRLKAAERYQSMRESPTGWGDNLAYWREYWARPDNAEAKELRNARRRKGN